MGIFSAIFCANIKETRFF